MNTKAIFDLRTDHDLTQKDIAKILGISRQYYSRYENGEVDIPIRHLITLANYYNTSLDYLCGILDTPEPLWRGSKPPKITPRPSEDDKLLEAYHRAPAKIKNAIKTLLEM